MEVVYFFEGTYIEIHNKNNVVAAKGRAAGNLNEVKCNTVFKKCANLRKCSKGKELGNLIEIL